MGQLCDSSGSRPSPQGIAKLKKVFRSTFSSGFKDAFAQQQGDVVFTVGNWNSVPLLRNFMSHASAALVSGTPLLHASLDAKDHQQCQNIQHGLSSLTCLDLTGWIPLEELSAGSSRHDQSHGSAGFMSCAYLTICWARTLLYPEAVEASGHAVAMMDLDVVLHKNLMEWMSKKRAASGFLLLGGKDAEGINLGVFYSSRDLLPLLRSWPGKVEKHFDDFIPDQTALNTLLVENPGKHLAIETSVLGMCGRPGEYATHYNCVDNKIDSMTKNGHWVPELGTSGDLLRKVSPVQH